MATIGKNILDNLTTGMYADSKVIYREYIQNACDQIDMAIEEGLIKSSEAVVDIFIDNKKRYISIKDNATGVKENEFVENVGDIANSNKKLGENKGFRGIGRLCGLAYCKTLKFTTSFFGENVKSIMICDGAKMRELLQDGIKHTIEEVWNQIITYDSSSEDVEKHYFEVELIDVNYENTDLLDKSKITEYLSFVAPVPYENKFILRHDIYKFTKENNLKIDEYNVIVNGLQVFKNYTSKIKDEFGNQKKIVDEIFRLEFKKFENDKGELIAWMWYGLSRFEKQIPKINLMRGIRLRSANIQIGNEDTLKNLFKESRGNLYFVGEVFAVDKNLIPNSQRDYFNENETRVIFEDGLRNYFFDILHKLYNEANKVKNDLKRQKEYIDLVNNYQEKVRNNGFIDANEKNKFEVNIETAKKKAEEARKRLEKGNDENDSSPIAAVRKSINDKFDSNALTEEASSTVINTDSNNNKKGNYVTNTMSKLSRSERKIVSKILTIISEIAPKDVAEEIIEKIKEEMK